ncbi:hypothetical protein D3C71_1635890 [compost metagenome]
MLYCAGDFSRKGAQRANACRYSHCCKRPASCILIEMDACSFSQMRGTPRKIVGATSRRSSCTVRMDSPKFTCDPRYSGTKVDSICSATWHSGRYDRCTLCASIDSRSAIPGATPRMLR